MSTVKACLDQNDFSPKEQSRCNKFISFLAVFALVNFFFQYTLFSTDLSIRTFLKPAALLQVVVSLSLIVVSLYIYYKNKVLHYLLRLLPCVFVSMILMNIFNNILGAAALVLWFVASIYVNRKYFKILALRKNYLRFIVWCTALIIVGSVIVAALTRGIATPSTVNMILFIGLVEGLGSTALLWQLLSKEIPHGLAVVIDSFEEREDRNLIDINATIICEKSSHKPIIIGKGGSMLKKIGSYAREDVEKLLDTKINLQLWVKVKERWRDSDYLIKNFGFDKKEL